MLAFLLLFLSIRNNLEASESLRLECVDILDYALFAIVLLQLQVGVHCGLQVVNQNFRIGS